MTERLELYKCNICGNLVEVILSGVGELVCCGESMEKILPHTHESETGEKHIPVVFENEDGCEIRIGATPHPMIKDHYIQFVEIISEDRNRVKLQYLYPDEDPVIKLRNKSSVDMARAYCNIHGLWEKE